MRWIIVILSLLPLTLLSQPQYEWAYGLGGPGDDWVADMITDEYGNVYVTGSFEEFLRYDTTFLASGMYDTTLFAKPPHDAFLLKLSPSGRLLWTKTVGNYGYDTGVALALNKEGILYWAGGFDIDIQLDGFSLTMADSVPFLGFSYADFFVAKVDTTTGECLSVRHVGDVGRDILQWLDIDQEDNLWIAGTTYSEELDFGGITIDSSEFFLAKYSSDDSLLLVLEGQLGDNPAFFNEGIIESGDISKKGNIHIGMNAFADFSIGGQQVCTGGCHLWLKVNSEGNLVMWRDITDFPGKIAAGPEESVFLAGFYDEHIQIDSLILSGGDRRNMYTLQFDSTGKLIWIDHWETGSLVGGSTPQVSEIAFRGNKLYWIGNMAAPLYPSNGDTLISAGLLDGVMTKYDQSGELDWTKLVGGNSDNLLLRLTLGPKGEVYTTGSFYSFITLADTIVIPNTFGGLDRFEYWIGKMQDSLFTTSLPASVLRSAIKVYPNPFQEQLHLEGLSPGGWQITCTNQLGQVVKEAGIIIRSPEEVWSVDMSTLPAGGYLLTLSFDTGGTVTLRLQHP